MNKMRIVLNAALYPSGQKRQRAPAMREQHLQFWEPVKHATQIHS
jgi:hypothetical protein